MTAQNKFNSKKILATAGTSGETKNLTTHCLTNLTSLNGVAAAYTYKLTYDGFAGKITTFLQPYCEPGYMLK